VSEVIVEVPLVVVVVDVIDFVEVPLDEVVVRGLIID
jgi:hypothetical protein